MKSKQTLTIVVMLIVGFAIGYYIAQSKLSSTNQTGAAVAKSKTSTVDTQTKIKNALTSSATVDKNGKLVSTGMSFSQSLTKVGLPTSTDHVNYYNCLGNIYFAYYQGWWWMYSYVIHDWVLSSEPAQYSMGACIEVSLA